MNDIFSVIQAKIGCMYKGKIGVKPRKNDNFKCDRSVQTFDFSGFVKIFKKN